MTRPGSGRGVVVWGYAPLRRLVSEPVDLSFLNLGGSGRPLGFYHHPVTKAPRSEVTEATRESGAPSMTRTCDLQVRNLTLYPTELWARTKNVSDPVFLTLLLATCQNSQLVSQRLGRFQCDLWKAPSSMGTWRREWDSNPRYPFGYTRSPGACLQPLGHLSFTAPPSVRLHHLNLAERGGFEPPIRLLAV